MRKDWDTYFIDLATVASTRATCPKRAVGAILVDRHHRVVSTGYNGSPPGTPHCEDVGCLQWSGRCIRVIHAEVNAISHAGWWKRRGTIMYCTHFPCLGCATAITKAGIVELVYKEKIKRAPDDVFALFEKEGIVVRQHNPG